MCSLRRVTSGQRILTKVRIACRAVIDDEMTPFAANTAAETGNAFRWTGQPKNASSLPLRGSGPHLIYLGSTRVSALHFSLPERHLDRFSRFCTAQERDRHTDRPTTLLRLWE